jgi:membrane-associated protease RseP (regulator of RpoE activity)
MKLKYILFIFMILCVVTSYCDAGGKEKIEIGILKYLGRHIDDFFRYIGLGFIMVFLKSMSWTKMTLGAFLSLIGAFFPKNDKDKKEEKGEAKISFSKLSFILKGSIRFAVVIAGIILIMGSIYEGVAGVENSKNSKKTPISEYVTGLKNLPNNYGLIGIYFVPMEDNSLLVTSVIKKSPADTSGMKVGDIIIKVDGLPIKQIPSKYILESIIGFPGTKVKLEIDRRGKNSSIEVFRIEGSSLAKLLEETIEKQGMSKDNNYLN